jgi:protein TonB
MSNMTFSLQPADRQARGPLALLRQKAIPFAAIIVVHGLLVLFAYLGLGHRLMPKAVAEPLFAQIVSPPPKPRTEPATVPMLPKNYARVDVPPPVVPVMPVIDVPPVQNTVTAAPPPAVAAPVETPSPVVAAAPPKPAGPRLVTTGIVPIRSPEPMYPTQSKGMGEHGKVTLRILINEKGLPANVQVEKSSGFPRLDAAAREAALRYLFKPYLEDGQAVAIFTLLPISFELNT